jgi:hypothetical protein
MLSSFAKNLQTFSAEHTPLNFAIVWERIFREEGSGWSALHFVCWFQLTTPSAHSVVIYTDLHANPKKLHFTAID